MSVRATRLHSAAVRFALFFWLLIGFAPIAIASVESLIEAELSFSRTTGKIGIKEGFLQYLAEDAILFRPHAVPGRQWIRDHPAPSGILSWKPSHAEISGADDLGFTTGPFTFREKEGEEPSSYGQFFSIWRKQPDGSWKVVLDAGINHEKPAGEIKLTSRAVGRKPASTELLAAEKKLLSSTDESAASISREIMADDVITLRNRQHPKRGIHMEEKASLATCQFHRDQLEISSSGDLAYVYGTYSCPGETGVYVRVWRKDDIWQIALDYRRADEPKVRAR